MSNTKPVHGLKGKMPKVKQKYHDNVTPGLLYFFENDVIKKYGPRPTVWVNHLVKKGALDDRDNTIVMTENRDWSKVLELNPGFTKKWLYSSDVWKNGRRVEWNTAKENYKLFKRNDKGWVSHCKFGERIQKTIQWQWGLWWKDLWSQPMGPEKEKEEEEQVRNSIIFGNDNKYEYNNDNDNNNDNNNNNNYLYC